MKHADIYLQQAGLKSLGFDPGALDGQDGPLTRAARSRWQASLTRTGPLAQRMVALAQGELSVRETSRNQGPGIAKYWTATSYATGYTSREPYCAAFICWLVAQATAATTAGDTAAPFPLPRTPVAWQLPAWAEACRKQGITQPDPAGTLLPGDIIIFTFSHTGILEKESAPGAPLHTIEANTSPGSTDNEGGGVWRRQRARALVRSVIRTGR